MHERPGVAERTGYRGLKGGVRRCRASLRRATAGHDDASRRFVVIVEYFRVCMGKARVSNCAEGSGEPWVAARQGHESIGRPGVVEYARDAVRFRKPDRYYR
jgi:hypothetical protein